MARLDVENLYTKRAYYFGVIALISYLVTSMLQGVKRLTNTNVPEVLFITILLVFVFCGIACLYTIIKARNEANSFKKVIATMLAIGSFVYILLLIKETLFH
ncbi:MAG: hypothetical protein ACI9Y7_001698 [Dokdonia sp.]|jgi:hypothetical protein